MGAFRSRMRSLVSGRLLAFFSSHSLCYLWLRLRWRMRVRQLPSPQATLPPH